VEEVAAILGKLPSWQLWKLAFEDGGTDSTTDLMVIQEIIDSIF
jgi:hypothetical protein